MEHSCVKRIGTTSYEIDLWLSVLTAEPVFKALSKEDQCRLGILRLVDAFRNGVMAVYLCIDTAEDRVVGAVWGHLWEGDTFYAHIGFDRHTNTKGFAELVFEQLREDYDVKRVRSHIPVTNKAAILFAQSIGCAGKGIAQETSFYDADMKLIPCRVFEKEI